MTRSIIFICAIFTNMLWHPAGADELDHYLSRTGPASKITIVKENAQGPSQVSFQSHVWRGIPWQHNLIIQSPNKLTYSDFVIISLTGGHGSSAHGDNARQLAEILGVRSAVLTQVPNQPLFGGKTEDDLLSFTLNEYRMSGDATWPLLFPMVTSVVKGIDVLEQVLGQTNLKVILIGASKRGWTTYLSAGVDRRIVGIVPAVFEMIAMPKQIALARARYGSDSEKIRPYTLLGLTDALTEPRVAQLVAWLDPVSYAKRYTMPKLVLLGANDPYWVIDSVREYWNHLPEPKMLKILPNVGHSALSEPSAREAIVSFVNALVSRQPLPQASWTFSASSNQQALISGRSPYSLAKCRLWRATSTIPDFRQAQFSETPCHIAMNGKSFQARVVTCPNRHTAAFAELLPEKGERVVQTSFSTASHVWLASPHLSGSTREVSSTCP